MGKKPFFRFFLLTITLYALFICSACGSEKTKAPTVKQSRMPTTEIVNLSANQTAMTETPILIESTSVDPDGIRFVELWVDGRYISTDANPQLSGKYTAVQQWRSPKPGVHVIRVKAIDKEGEVGWSLPVTITLENPVIIPIATVEPSITPLP